MNDQLQDTLDKASDFGHKFANFTAKHRIVIIFLIASSAIMLALLQSRTYLNPERDEARYEEERVLINYSTVDQEIVDKLSATLEDQDINVDSNFVPNRNNPFSE